MGKKHSPRESKLTGKQRKKTPGRCNSHGNAFLFLGIGIKLLWKKRSLLNTIKKTDLLKYLFFSKRANV